MIQADVASAIHNGLALIAIRLAASVCLMQWKMVEGLLLARSEV